MSASVVGGGGRAPLLATVVLVAWSILTLMPLDSRLGNVWHMTGPFVLWITGTGTDPHLLGGSPVWRLGYVIALIGLAAVSALLHGSDGRTRETLRAGWSGSPSPLWRSCSSLR